MGWKWKDKHCHPSLNLPNRLGYYFSLSLSRLSFYLDVFGHSTKSRSTDNRHFQLTGFSQEIQRNRNCIQVHSSRAVKKVAPFRFCEKKKKIETIDGKVQGTTVRLDTQQCSANQHTTTTHTSPNQSALLDIAKYIIVLLSIEPYSCCSTLSTY